MKYDYEQYDALSKAFGALKDHDAPRVERALHAAIADACPQALEISIERENYRRWITTLEVGAPAVVEVGGVTRFGDLHIRVSAHNRHHQDAKALHDLLVQQGVEIAESETGTPEKALRSGNAPTDDLPF